MEIDQAQGRIEDFQLRGVREKSAQQVCRKGRRRSLQLYRRGAYRKIGAFNFREELRDRWIGVHISMMQQFDNTKAI